MLDLHGDILDVPAFASCVHQQRHRRASSQTPQQQIVGIGTEAITALVDGLIGDEGVALRREELGILVVGQVLDSHRPHVILLALSLVRKAYTIPPAGRRFRATSPAEYDAEKNTLGDQMDLKHYIRDIPDFPQPGILFRDITPLLRTPAAMRHVLDQYESRYRGAGIDVVVGIESRGFLFGTPLADRLGLPFVPVRKPGKLPAERMSMEYTLEYGTSQLDIHSDAMQRGQRALIVDDLLATGGTAHAAAKLVELVGGSVAELVVLIELVDLGGRDRLRDYEVFALLAL